MTQGVFRSSDCLQFVMSRIDSGGSAVYTWAAILYGTSRMALSLKDKETDSLARQVARPTGETLRRPAVLDHRSEDEILGYGENGLPS